MDLIEKTNDAPTPSKAADNGVDHGNAQPVAGTVGATAAPPADAGAGRERPLPPTSREAYLVLAAIIERIGGQHDPVLSEFVAKVRAAVAFEDGERRAG